MRLCLGTVQFGGDYGIRGGRKPSVALARSLKRLKTDYLDAYVCHVATAVSNAAICEAMAQAKESGLVRHVGFSVYETDEAKSCAANGVCDFMQVPFSVLDQRMATDGALSAAAAKGMTVHARSAFVQGLALMEENIAAFGETVPENVLDEAERIFHDVDSDLVMPNKWRKG